MKEDRNEARPRVCGVGGERARLREACANIAEYARSAQCHTEDAHVLGYLNQIEGWAKAALAEPPRNCDKYATVKEATEAFARERQDMPHPCPDFTFSRWLLTPVKKEGGDK